MIKQFNIKSMTILILVILLSTITAQAISNTNVQPITQKINLDSSFVVYINVTPGTNIAGMQTNIKFDPTIIKIDSITEGNLFNRGRSTFFSSGIIDNVNGTVINIFNAILGPYSTNITGTFIEIRGTPIKKGTSQITLNNVKISKPDGTSEPLTYTNATVVVAYPSWDVNEDGITDILDLTIVASHFGEYTSGRWDVNGIPPVDIFDLVATSSKI